MLRWHRLVAFIALPVMLYIVATGAGIEGLDMAALVGRAPETSPSMRRMREHVYGPPNYAVVSATDYAAPALPPHTDYVGGIERAAELGRAAAPGAPLRLVELRMFQGRAAAHVRMGEKDLAFDVATGRRLSDAALPWPQPPQSLQAPRATVKSWHRLQVFGPLGATANILAGIGVSAMLTTGLAQYWRLYKARLRMGSYPPFWSTGAMWRRLHRWVSIGALLPIVWLVASGLALAVDNVIPGVAALASARHAPPIGPDPFSGDFSKPIRDAELPAMTRATLAAFDRQEPRTPIKVLNLRYFADYPQGVVIAADPDTTQRVYNTATGAPMSMDEPGYPRLFFPSGWEWHQRLKRIHRGDVFGMPGRWLACAAAVSLLYLLVSGVVMYIQLWQRRAGQGRKQLVWR